VMPGAVSAQGAGARAPADPAKTDRAVACAASFVLGASVWPKERDAFLVRTQLVVDQHLAALPDLDRAETEQKVREDAQSLANRLQSGELSGDKFKADVQACAREYGVENPFAAPSPDRSPESLYDEGRQLMQTNRAAGQQLILQACNAGHLDACVGYAQIGGPQGRTVEADKAIAFALGKACSLGDGQSCYSVAYRLDPSTAFGGFVRELRSSANAKMFYERACREHKHQSACKAIAGN